MCKSKISDVIIACDLVKGESKYESREEYCRYEEYCRSVTCVTGTGVTGDWQD
jgi:hypothetical protein